MVRYHFAARRGEKQVFCQWVSFMEGLDLDCGGLNGKLANHRKLIPLVGKSKIPQPASWGSRDQTAQNSLLGDNAYFDWAAFW
jgi:hypothetical protein